MMKVGALRLLTHGFFAADVAHADATQTREGTNA